MSRCLPLLSLLGLLGCGAPADGASPAGTEAVVLLHGLARTTGSMDRLALALSADGYAVHNLDYPDQSAPFDEIVGYVASAVKETCGEATRIHFVTHSLGGLVARRFARDGTFPNLGRLVLLAPPNQGSEVVDRLAPWFFFRWLNGPVGSQLGTGADSVPNMLGPVPAGVEVGVIAGDRSMNPLLSRMIPGTDDGKVAVARTHLAGMKEHRVVHATHTLIMRDAEVIRLVRGFLREGTFGADD